MGCCKIGSECCNNCVHWDCGERDDKHGVDKVYTSKNCAKCTSPRGPRKGLNTLHDYVCQYFSHIWGITKTFSISQDRDGASSAGSPCDKLTAAYIEGIMADLEHVREPSRTVCVAQKDSRQIAAEPEDDFNGEEERDFSRTMAEVGRANDRVHELQSEGLHPRNAMRDVAVEFMHLLDKANSGDARSQYVLARSFEHGDHGAMSWEEARVWKSGSNFVMRWLERSAKNGYAEAAHLLGCYCRDGKYGCWAGDDHLDAYRWLKCAVELGRKEAFVDFNEVRQKILGDSVDLMVKSVEHLRHNDIDFAVLKVKEISEQMKGGSNGRDDGVMLLCQVEPEIVDRVVNLVKRLACECDCKGKLKYMLGCMYCHLKGFDKIIAENYGEGFDWFKAAETDGNNDAKEYLSTSKRALEYAEGLALSNVGNSSEPDSILNAGWKVYRMRSAWVTPGNEEKEKKAFALFEKAYELAGENLKPAAAFALARCYYHHSGVGENEDKALQLFKQAALKWFEDPADGYEYEYPDACKYIADIYGHVEQHSYRKEWLVFAANCGNKDAMEELGEECLDGDDLPVDYEGALYWLQLCEWLYGTDTRWKEMRTGDSPLTKAKAKCGKNVRDVFGGLFDYSDTLISAGKGDAAAQCQVGRWFMSGLCGMKKDVRISLVWFYRAAKKGNADAQCRIGYAYYFGKGVENDYAKAAEWFAKAAEQGLTDAQLFLGTCYKNGLGVGKSLEKAFELYSKAAEDQREAKFWLGWYFWKGVGGVEANAETAFEWFVKAAEDGHARSMNNVGWFYRKGIGIEQDFVKAAGWFGKGVAKGDGNCANNLAFLYENGMGVERDLDKAVELLLKATEWKSGRAYYHLGRFYENGLGVDVDLATAKEYYAKAAESGDDDAKAALERLG